MGQLSFQTFCIEFYSHHIQKRSDEVYRILDLLFIQRISESRLSVGQRGRR